MKKLNNGTIAIYDDELYEEIDVLEKIDYSLCKENLLYEGLKRIMDIVLASIGLIVGIPLMIVFGVLIKIEDRGPILYKQVRVGKYGETFVLYKLRSMRVDAEKFGARWAQKNDPRILKVGKLIRKTRIDEIPQLFNVLKGNMTIVGPRPERPMFTYQFEESTPGFINRLLVKPGLTGWAQVNGGYDMLHYEKLKWDIEYIKTRNLFIDIKIIILTTKILINGEGAR